MGALTLCGAGKPGGSSLLTGLLAWWNLDESSGQPRLDASGHGATLTDSGGVGSVGGVIGNAAVFRNADGFYLSRNTPLVTSGALSIALWANVLGGGAEGFAFVQGDGIGINAQYLRVSSGQPGWAVDGFTALTGSPISYDAWHHLVGTYDGTTGRLYVDGTQAASGALAADYSSVAALTMGANSGGSSVADVAADLCGVWSRALSAAEVTALYNGGAGRTWPF